MRIVSLLPSTTEILFGIGAGDDVVGVTFECDYPPEARSRRVVSTSAMPAGLTAREIDDFVAAALARGDDLYHLEAQALAELDADIVVTQDLCAVCAVDVSVVGDALDYLGCHADVVTIDPATLDEVFASVLLLGDRTGHRAAADAVVRRLQARLREVEAAVAGRERPRVLLLEWTDPPFAPGHWIPEMVERAGGDPVLGRTGEKSFRITWADARAARPDVVVCAPCGFDVERAAELAQAVGDELRGVPVWAVDANASFARPGLRLVDGVETLAAIFHPSVFGPPQQAQARLIAAPSARL